MKKLLCRLIGLLIIISLTSCGGANNQKGPTLKVGTISGPETELMEVAKQVARDRYQLTLEIIEFSDYSMPNTALNDGSIDANVFQHLPYLRQTINATHYPLIIVGKTFIYPMGMYTQKNIKLGDLQQGASVAIPNDPTNEARALLLMEKAGLITLGTCNAMTATVNCIHDNPKNLQITSLKAAQLPRSLQDVDIALINTNYAMPADLLPHRDAIFLEGPDSLYANVIVVKEKDKNDPRVEILIKALNSPEVVEAAKRIFAEEAIAAW